MKIIKVNIVKFLNCCIITSIKSYIYKPLNKGAGPLRWGEEGGDKCWIAGEKIVEIIGQITDA